MNKNTLKQLAENTIENGEVNLHVAEFVLKKLTKSELKQYGFYLKQTINKQTIVVKSANTIDSDTKDKLEKMFEGKTLQYEVDESLGGGLYIKADDTIIDTSILGSIKNTVKQLKQIV